VRIYLEDGRLIIESADKSVTETNRGRLERFLAALKKLEGQATLRSAPRT
jgi:hypothetical protein